jgi:hypothetical protein
MDQIRNKILTPFIMCLMALLLLCPLHLRAAQDVSRIRVTVAPIDTLQVSDATNGILLSLDDVTGSDALTGESDQTARLNYMHNSAINKKITAQVNPQDIPSGPQSITLRVAVSGASEQCIVEGGVSQGAKEVLSGLTSGYWENVPVKYTASATASGSRPGEYAFRVTFTSLDDD